MATRKRTTRKVPLETSAGLIERLHIVQPTKPSEEDWCWVLIPGNVPIFDDALRPIVLQRGLAVQVPKDWLVLIPTGELEVQG